MQATEPAPQPTLLVRLIGRAIEGNGGWLPFDRYMALALYAPGLGYYSRGSRQFGTMPSSGSDFVTAPELSPLFGRALAVQVRQALDACDSAEVWEFGAGSGALAEQLIEALGSAVQRYSIVDLSGSLRAIQQQRLAHFGDRVRWLDALPERIDGVVVGNEVLDAMPVQLIHFDGAQWFERGVVTSPDGSFAWSDRPTDLRPPVDFDSEPGTTTELHAQAEAFIATLAERLGRGAAFFIDYGFPAHEYYLPQRTGGTLMCHRGHLADTDPLVNVGEKDITAHVDFTGIALAAQDAGLEVIGYTSQASFLINCGIADRLDDASPQGIAPVQKLLAEHEMGELFKVIGMAKRCAEGYARYPVGFSRGDRSHKL